MIKNYRWANTDFGMNVEIAVDTSVFTEEMAMEHINFFVNSFDSDEESAIDYAIRSHAQHCLYIAVQDRVNVHGVIHEMENSEGYFPVDGSKGLVLISVDGLEIDLKDDWNFNFYSNELAEMPEPPEMRL